MTGRHIIGDLVLAFGLLTRLPLPRLDLDPARNAQAAWAWPIVGAVVGGIGVGVAAISLAAGLPAMVAAALAMIAMALTTGGLHEDGLADTADGLWGGATRARRLEIMRDSRVGAYGVLALGLMLILRFAGIAALLEAGGGVALVAAAVLARTGMAVMMLTLKPARSDGLSKTTGRPDAVPVALAVGASVIMSAICGLPLLSWIAVGLVLVWLMWQASTKLGGQTGDTLGAGCLVAETAALIAAI